MCVWLRRGGKTVHCTHMHAICKGPGAHVWQCMCTHSEGGEKCVKGSTNVRVHDTHVHVPYPPILVCTYRKDQPSTTQVHVPYLPFVSQEVNTNFSRYSLVIKRSTGGTEDQISSLNRSLYHCAVCSTAVMQLRTNTYTLCSSSISISFWQPVAG